MPTITSSPPVAVAPQRRSRVRGLGRQLGIAAGWFMISYLLSMLIWVLGPQVVRGWTPLVIVSGSMAPSIQPGDVVLVDPQADEIRPGSVVAFSRDGMTPVLHRILEQRDDGTYTTKGDANLSPDSTPVAAEEMLGQGRLIVPNIGFPKLWIQHGAGFLLFPAVGALFYLLRRRRLAFFIVAGSMVGWFMFSATAAFADETLNTGSSASTVTLQAPSNLAASCTSGTAVGSPVPIDLGWTASVTPQVANYEIWYDAPPVGGGFVQVGTVSAPQTTFTHTIPAGDVAVGMPHTYVVRGVVGSFSSPDSAPATVTITVVLLVYVCS